MPREIEERRLGQVLQIMDEFKESVAQMILETVPLVRVPFRGCQEHVTIRVEGLNFDTREEHFLERFGLVCFAGDGWRWSTVELSASRSPTRIRQT